MNHLLLAALLMLPTLSQATEDQYELISKTHEALSVKKHKPKEAALTVLPGHFTSPHSHRFEKGAAIDFSQTKSFLTINY